MTLLRSHKKAAFQHLPHPLIGAAAALWWLTACDPAPPSSAALPPTAVAPTAVAPTLAATSSATHSRKTPVIEWVSAPDGDVVDIVKFEKMRAENDGRTLIVYVGATWCEPCQVFHHAAEKGDLPGELPPLRMLEFDLDKDGERLATAGYTSKFIPLFIVPTVDGHPGPARMEGSIKGSGATANIVPRLRVLLARSKGS